MTNLLIQLGAVLATVGPVAIEQEVEWPAVDALRIPAVVQPLPVSWRTEAEPVKLDDEIRLARNLELPVSLTIPEVPRR